MLVSECVRTILSGRAQRDQELPCHSAFECTISQGAKYPGVFTLTKNQASERVCVKNLVFALACSHQGR